MAKFTNEAPRRRKRDPNTPLTEKPVGSWQSGIVSHEVHEFLIDLAMEHGLDQTSAVVQCAFEMARTLREENRELRAKLSMLANENARLSEAARSDLTHEVRDLFGRFEELFRQELDAALERHKVGFVEGRRGRRITFQE